MYAFLLLSDEARDKAAAVAGGLDLIAQGNVDVSMAGINRNHIEASTTFLYANGKVCLECKGIPACASAFALLKRLFKTAAMHRR